MSDALPEPVDMEPMRKQFVKDIKNAYKDNNGEPPYQIGLVINGLLVLWQIVEREIRRIDNEITEAVCKQDQ